MRATIAAGPGRLADRSWGLADRSGGLADRSRGLADRSCQNAGVIHQLVEMPGGVRLFLVYALLILAGIGIALPSVVAQAVDVPITLPGLVTMILLAYTIFTTTLVLQRKEASRTLALGLASLTIPAVPLLLLGGLLLPALVVLVFAVALFRGLTRPSVRTYLSEP
jgi:hypothetical protein